MENTTTYNWDTVSPAPISGINKVIKSKGNYPKSFFNNVHVGNVEYQVKGDFDLWQIICGGDGRLVQMELTISNFLMNFKDRGIETSVSFDNAKYQVEVKLNYLPHDTTYKNITKVDLKINTNNKKPEDPPVIQKSDFIDLKNLKIDTNFEGLEDVYMQIAIDQTNLWLKNNLNAFSHVFNTININKYIEDEPQWRWSKPTYVDYAYVDVNEDPNKSLLGVLCMTDGRTGTVNQQQKVSANAIPSGSNGVFMISEDRVLKDMLLPTLIKKFKYSTIEDFEVVHANEDEDYEYILKLKKEKTFQLDTFSYEGREFHPKVIGFQIVLKDNELRMTTDTETSLLFGSVANCTTVHRYKIVLAKNKKGEQTLNYEEVEEPVEQHTITKGDGEHTHWIIVVSLFGILLEAILGVLTAGVTLFISTIILTILTGILANIPEIIDNTDMNNAPSLDLFVENTAAQIVWNGSDILKLNYAGLHGPLLLGGQLSFN